MLVPAIALGSASGASTVATAVVATLTVLVVCEMTVARRLTPGALCATVGLASVALLPGDELVALASGTTLSASIQASLDELSAGRTSIIIAHRLSTIRGADRVAVVEDEHIVESGAPDELLQKGGEFAKLWNSQFK